MNNLKHIFVLRSRTRTLMFVVKPIGFLSAKTTHIVWCDFPRSISNNFSPLFFNGKRDSRLLCENVDSRYHMNYFVAGVLTAH